MAVEATKVEEVLTGRVETYWYLVGKRLRKHKLAMISLVVLILIILACVVGPYLSPYHVAALGSTEEVMQPPSLKHPLGTDELGRDVLTR
jgi:peptide/nickel transport system permease protein